MKRAKILIAAGLVFLVSCGGFYMVEKDTKPEIKAKPGKATLVIYRGTSFGFALVINNFLDKKFIGQTKGKCYFITDVEPGTHYVFASAENNSCAKIDFEAGKVYYLLQAIYPGVMAGRTGFSGSDPGQFEKDLPGLEYLVYEPTDDEPELDEEEYAQTIADHERELKEEPEKHKDTSKIQGY